MISAMQQDHPINMDALELEFDISLENVPVSGAEKKKNASFSLVRGSELLLQSYSQS